MIRLTLPAMMLFVNGRCRGIQCSNLGYWVNDYESAFEILTQLVADQWLLQDATIVDDHSRVAIPVEAFDGQPIQTHIYALQHQWKQILSTHPALLHSPQEQWLKSHFVQLDAYYGTMLTHLQKMIILYRLRKTKLVSVQNAELKIRLEAQYDLLLEDNMRMHEQLEMSRQKNQLRLDQLNDPT